MYTAFFAQHLRSKLLERIGELGLTRFDATNLQTAMELEIPLEHGVPIGAKRRYSDDDIQEALVCLEDLNPRSSLERSRQAFDMFRESSVRVSEVLSAGWIARSKGKVDLLKKAFSLANPSDIFPSLRKTLEDQDDLLIKSIEMIAVMQFHWQVAHRYLTIGAPNRSTISHSQQAGQGFGGIRTHDAHHSDSSLSP